MPYIAIKSFPKDEETRRRAVEKVNAAIQEAFACPPDYISISFEEVEPEAWDENVVKAEIEPGADKMYILNGKKLYQD